MRIEGTIGGLEKCIVRQCELTKNALSRIVLDH
jgi:hypothetical protein